MKRIVLFLFLTVCFTSCSKKEANVLPMGKFLAFCFQDKDGRVYEREEMMSLAEKTHIYVEFWYDDATDQIDEIDLVDELNKSDNSACLFVLSGDLLNNFVGEKNVGFRVPFFYESCNHSVFNTCLHVGDSTVIIKNWQDDKDPNGRTDGSINGTPLGYYEVVRVTVD